MIIAIVNNKGGTGKTTTGVNLSAALANLGHRVLLVDLDSQASASISLGVPYSELSPSSADVLFDELPIESATRNTNIRRLDLLPGGLELAHSDLILADVPGREDQLAESLMPVRDGYDFIICDCPPSLSMLPVNALVAADRYVVPVTPEYLALEGLTGLMCAVDLIREGMDINVEMLGILFTMVNPARFRLLNKDLRSQLDIMDLVRGRYGKDVFKTVIRRSVSLSKAPSYGHTIFEHAPRSSGAQEYAQLAGEVLERCGISAKEAKSDIERNVKERRSEQ